MIVNGFPPQRAFTPFLFTSRASANQACRRADISSNASTRHMSCALDVYHPDESANLPQHVLQLCCAFGMLMVRPYPIQYFQEQATQENILCNFLLNANQHGTQAYKQDFAVCRSKISQIWPTAAGTTLKKLPLVLQSFFGLQIGMVGWAMFWRLPCILIFTKKLSVACHIKGEDSSELLWGFAQTLSSQWGIALDAKVFGPIGSLGNRLHCCTKIVPHLIVIPKPWQSQIFFGNLVDSELIWYSIFIDIWSILIHSDPIIRILAEPWLPGEEPRARAWACNTHQFLAPSPWRMKRLADAVGVRDPFWIL